ncbi:hypothetical protein PR202_ga20773 [Eleusine coracana subsp. coracana]|uniref:Uncharacterized protein n=1 Tax=Eleusine coracana subsp. coracana TaxID=191504 RepID=A0AAV5CZW6_ELECO|nr:hypothetical protein PR202_ga20773 [Eleusine coracana subsp. coracana]
MAGCKRAFAIFAVAVHLCLAVSSSSSLDNTDPRNGRTAYHFQPATNRMNGPLYHKGVYHLFYQYNPHGPLWDIGNLSWGHSVSRDLVNWAALPTVIDPTSPFDNNGCWSGSATVLPCGIPAILYTGISASKVQVQNVAFPKNASDPLLREWDKTGLNPVMPLPAEVPANKFRDPSTAWIGKDGLWRVAVSGEVNGVGSTLVYKSKNFLHWDRNPAPLHASRAAGMVECPDLFPVAEHRDAGLDTLVTGPGVKHVLKLSVMDTLEDYYMVGTYDETTDAFVPTEPGRGDDYRNWRRFNYGHVYASKSFFDAGKSRRVLWTWINESDSRDDDVARGWSGIQAFPRKVWLDKDGKQLLQWPVEEIETLRRKRVGLRDGTWLRTGALKEIAGVTALQADVEAVFEIPSLEGAETFDPSWETDAQKLCGVKGATVHGGVGPFGLIVMVSGYMKEHTAIFFRVFKHHDNYKVLMCTDLTSSSTKSGVYKPPYGGFVEMDDIQKHKTINLRTLLDHSVIESFGDGGRTCITTRLYPEHVSKRDSHIFVFNNGTGAVKVSKLEAWNLATAAVNVGDGNMM